MLQQAILILGLCLTARAAQAGSFDYLPSTQPAEKEFSGLMNSGDFKHALTTWNSAYGASSFAQSQNGKATFALILYKNGMSLSGLNLLFTTSVRNLDPNLVKIWTTELKNSVWIQKGWKQTTGSWKSVIDNSPADIKIRKTKDIQQAFAKAQAISKDNQNKKARIWWQIATQAPQLNQTEPAVKALNLIRESSQNAIGNDQVSLAMGRVLYQKGDLEGSMAAYLEIPKSSNLWTQGVEERTWISVRKADYDKALGETVTLLSSTLAPLVGPESYYLANLMALRVCDYPRIFKNSETFKSRHSERLAAIQELSKTGTNKNSNALLEHFDQKGVSIESAGPLVSWIPRAAYRDQKFLKLMESRRQWLAEGKRAAELLDSGAVLGSVNALEGLPQEARLTADQMKQQAVQRLRVLAAEELKEYRQNLNRMHIVEGEVIQRLAVDENLKGKRSQVAKVEDKGDVLVFPYSSDEVWLDELDNYKARVKDCPTLKGASL